MVFSKVSLGWACALALVLTGCKPAAETWPLTQVDGRTMGTYFTVKITDPLTASEQKTLRQQINATLKLCNQQISTYDPHSELSLFNQSTILAPQPVSEALADMVTQALRTGEQSGQALDVTVGPLVNLWGFGPDKRPVKTPTADQITAVRSRVGLSHLKVMYAAGQAYLQKDIPGVYVDLSSMGEGMGAEAVAEMLESHGVQNYLVEVAGTSRSRGLNDKGEPWRLAIQQPSDEINAVQAIIEPNGRAVSTSGSYRNYYELDGKRYSHIIDPATGFPISHRLVSATVVMDGARKADSWATSLMVMGPDKAFTYAKEHGMAVYLIAKTDKGFSVRFTDAFKPYLVEQN